MSTDKSLVICYTNTNTGNTGYEATNKSQEEWTATHPNCKIDYVFQAKNDKMSYEQTAEFAFWVHYLEYGFLATDLHGVFVDAKSNRCEFIGLLPKNTRFKCLIRDCETNKYYKVTPEYVKHRLKEHAC